MLLCLEPLCLRHFLRSDKVYIVSNLPVVSCRPGAAGFCYIWRTPPKPKGASKMLPCHDNYATTFDNYSSMLSYHQTLSIGTHWHRCKVKDLHVEPLDGSSPLCGNPAAFATGTTLDAVTDTVENLGLALSTPASSLRLSLGSAVPPIFARSSSVLYNCDPFRSGSVPPL